MAIYKLTALVNTNSLDLEGVDENDPSAVAEFLQDEDNGETPISVLNRITLVRQEP